MNKNTRSPKTKDSLWNSCVFVPYILADLISSLEIQRLQLAGSSSTVFAANLILYNCYEARKFPLLHVFVDFKVHNVQQHCYHFDLDR